MGHASWPQSHDRKPTSLSGTETFWAGVRVGTLPLVVLPVLAGGTVASSLLVRQLTTSEGFFAQQQAALLTLIIGGLVAGAGYIVTVIRAWQRLSKWYREGARAPAQGALAALSLTALLVLLPIILAFVVPQQAAP